MRFLLISLVFIHLSHQSSLLNNLHHSINSNYLETYGTGSAKNLPPDLSTPELITRRGYPVETHEIITDDNYILTAHRIPYGKRSPAGYSKYPIFILHGGAQSSADWVLNFEEDNCLPFLLANIGYDVWLGNIRGNMYSNRHLNLSQEQTSFWNFSLDELAEYDMPNTIDYILAKTNRPKLSFIGFSLGNTQFLMALANKPEYNDKIGVHISYAPSIFFGTFPDQSRLNAYLARPLRVLQNLSGGFPVPPQGITFLLTQILPTICNPKIDLLGICRQIMFLILGFGPEQISRDQTPSLLGHLLTPTSLKILIHLMQMTNSDRFCHYDHRQSKNMEIYGQPAPPDYYLNQVNSPAALFLAKGDIFANEKGVTRLTEALPNVVDYYTVPYDKFTHIDFTYGSSANYLVYNHTIQLLNHFSYN